MKVNRSSFAKLALSASVFVLGLMLPRGTAAEENQGTCEAIQFGGLSDNVSVIHEACIWNFETFRKAPDSVHNSC